MSKLININDYKLNQSTQFNLIIRFHETSSYENIIQKTVARQPKLNYARNGTRIMIFTFYNETAANKMKMKLSQMKTKIQGYDSFVDINI